MPLFYLLPNITNRPIVWWDFCICIGQYAKRIKFFCVILGRHLPWGSLSRLSSNLFYLYLALWLLITRCDYAYKHNVFMYTYKYNTSNLDHQRSRDWFALWVMPDMIGGLTQSVSCVDPLTNCNTVKLPQSWNFNGIRSIVYYLLLFLTESFYRKTRIRTKQAIRPHSTPFV